MNEQPNITKNLLIYNAVRAVPAEAKKPITGGRLSGKTDINPMWRIKVLTEIFGPCGFGWKPEIVKQWLEPGENGEVSAFCNINLYVKYNDAWSDPIPGTGGSKYIVKEKNDYYTDDDAFKKAYTDALSVACKMLGVGADVYWDADPTKYNDSGQPKEPAKTPQEETPDEQTPEDKEKLRTASKGKINAAKDLLKKWGYESSKDIPHSRVDEFIKELESA